MQTHRNIAAEESRLLFSTFLVYGIGREDCPHILPYTRIDVQNAIQKIWIVV